MSTRTETSICNMAADFLDATAIGHIDDDRDSTAPIYKRNYREAVETVITEFSWNSAKARAKLAPIVLDETFRDGGDFQNAYAYPADCLGPIDINGRPCRDLRWDVETIAILDQHGNVSSRRRVLWCEFGGPILLRYKTLVSPSDMSAHLAKAIALELAMRVCTKVTNSTSKMQELQRLYTDATRGTMSRVGGHQVDSRENRPKPSVILPSTGQMARAGGGL